jgi:hypothetical protein
LPLLADLRLSAINMRAHSATRIATARMLNKITRTNAHTGRPATRLPLLCTGAPAPPATAPEPPATAPGPPAVVFVEELFVVVGHVVVAYVVAAG